MKNDDLVNFSVQYEVYEIRHLDSCRKQIIELKTKLFNSIVNPVSFCFVKKCKQVVLPAMLLREQQQGSKRKQMNIVRCWRLL
jgi:hypothetical protein